MWLRSLVISSRYKNNFIYSCKFPKKYSVIAHVIEKVNIGEATEIKGWVKNLRIQKELIFADVSDGSCAQSLQVIIPKQFKTNSLTYGASVHIIGKLSKSPRGQLELVAENVNILGDCIVADGYPFNPRTLHPPEYIRQYLHLRSRTNYMSAILRVRNSVTKHIHDYFSSKHYINIHTPVLTSNDCEGAGEVFKIKPDSEGTIKAMIKDGAIDDTAYFGTKTFLTVSGQLHLEAICRGMGNVYTFGPTFRAENTRSRLHLSEFYMLEAEIAFCHKIEMLRTVIEDLLKYLFLKVYDTNEADFHLIDKDKANPPNWLNKEFIVMSFDEARQILQNRGFVGTEEGFNKEHELDLVQYTKGVPIFIERWPNNLKSFYMKECQDDNGKVDALDLLAPITGEIVGGSLREDNYEKLKSKLPSDKLNWYLELRKFGNIPTGGFGLGLERLLQVMCGVTNIKDTLPFPRWPHNCDM